MTSDMDTPILRFSLICFVNIPRAIRTVQLYSLLLKERRMPDYFGHRWVCRSVCNGCRQWYGGVDVPGVPFWSVGGEEDVEQMKPAWLGRIGISVSHRRFLSLSSSLVQLWYRYRLFRILLTSAQKFPLNTSAPSDPPRYVQLVTYIIVHYI